MSSEPVIEARGLGKAYPIYRKSEDRLRQLLWGRWHRYYEEFWAVRDVNLNVDRGETVGIIGRNGSGKSTLLQMICGTLRPTAGEVRVRGRVAAMLELGSGFNPQFTGRENVKLGAAVLGLGAAEIEARFESIAAFADIGAFLDQPMKNYSSGMHARLAFAVCANVDADILIVDEILSVGDAAFQQKCMRYLNRFRLHGTLLFVSHDSGAVVKLCDRALWLDQGEVRGLGQAKEMCRLYLAAQAEESANDSGGFRLGGQVNRSWSKGVQPIIEQTSSGPVFDNVADAEELTFDPDGTWIEDDDVAILSAAFYDPGGSGIHVAAGGESVELRVNCRAARPLPRPVVAFVVRDRLGQVIFADDTASTYGACPPGIAAGQSFSASFGFFLPYLASGVYAIQAFVFDGSADDCAPLTSRRDKEFLHIQSSHPSNGLANIGMRAVSIGVVEAPHNDTENSSAPRASAPEVAAETAQQ